MEPKFNLSFSGQEVETEDLNAIAQESGLADDHIIAELFRISPFDGTNVSKGIIPYAGGRTVIPKGAADSRNANGGANGSVTVNPFRVVIGSINNPSTPVPNSQDYDYVNPAKQNWRDARSGIFIGSATTLGADILFANNSSGDPRWDLVYVTFNRDVAQTPTTRYVKSVIPPPLSAPVTLSAFTLSNLTVQVVQGTPGGAPVLPSVPADTAGVTYNIPLCYVLIPNGFTSTSTINNQFILDAAPVLNISQVTGALSSVPANTTFNPTGAMLSATGTTTGLINWDSGNRPPCYMPPSMRGEEVIYIPLDLKDPTLTSNWSQPPDSILDDSRDWRNRVFKFDIVFNTGASSSTAWWYGANPANGIVPFVNAISNWFASGMGQSFIIDSTSINPNAALVAWTNSASLHTGSAINIYVDMSTGAIKYNTLVSSSTTFPGAFFFIRLAASGKFPNP